MSGLGLGSKPVDPKAESNARREERAESGVPGSTIVGVEGFRRGMGSGAVAVSGEGNVGGRAFVEFGDKSGGVAILSCDKWAAGSACGAVIDIVL